MREQQDVTATIKGLPEKRNRNLSRLTQRFAQLQPKKEKALVCFVTAGDPPGRTVEIVETLAQAGADAIEIGLPFSDPLADGPSIQASSQRALDNGMTVVKALEIVRAIRKRAPDLPLILMTYYNPILRYGLARYAADAKAAGADAHIVTDLTPEESDEWKRLSTENELDTIFLLAPTSTQERIEVVGRLSSGFIYCVSRTGVTGAREDIPAELMDMVARIRMTARVPICVGFGVSRPEQVRRIASFADGVVVGSALVDLIHLYQDDPNLLALVADYVASLKAATYPL
jgi:tryptophan synthase alpha chain